VVPSHAFSVFVIRHFPPGQLLQPIHHLIQRHAIRTDLDGVGGGHQRTNRPARILSVAPLLGEAILRNNRGLSISELFV